MAAILGLWVATIPFPWIREFGRLEPAKMDLTQSMWTFYILAGVKGLRWLIPLVDRTICGIAKYFKMAGPTACLIDEMNSLKREHGNN